MAAVTVTAANVRHSEYATVVNKIAGATITAGKVLYIKDDGTVSPVNAFGNPPAPGYESFGIAVNNAATGQDVDVCTRDPQFTAGFSVTPGEPYVAGDSGAIHPVSDIESDLFTTIIGVGITPTKINLFDVANCRADVAHV